MSRKIKVLVVDDSALVRKITTDILESDPDITVVGTANNGQTAIYRNKQLDPDVITMDIEMPILDGLSALREIIYTNPKPIIMMSVLTQHGAEATFQALEYGAVDFIPKPSSMLNLTVDEIGELLIAKVKNAYKSKVKPLKRLSGEPPLEEKLSPGRRVRIPVTPPPEKVTTDKKTSSRLIGIGTSTGGPSALINIFRSFPKDFPSSILVVQHMPEGFTRAFSERLDTISELKVKEAEEGDEVKPGWAYIAPGHSHMAVDISSRSNRLRVYPGEKVRGHRPSIDVLFHSMADRFGENNIGVIMTGMGRDGADGILRIRDRGGYTIAQNEETSVVFGMNRVAVQNGAIVDVLPLSDIAKKIVEHL